MLVNRPVIGRGAYSVILGGEASVFKLTMDGAAYALAEQQSSWRSSALPEIRALHGKVGAVDCGVPIYLFEMEHLDRLTVGSAERKTCLAIARHLRPFYKDGPLLSGCDMSVRASRTHRWLRVLGCWLAFLSHDGRRSISICTAPISCGAPKQAKRLSPIHSWTWKLVPLR